MPLEPLNYQTVTKSDASPKGQLARVGKLCLLIYVSAVAGFAVVKLVAPLDTLPWPELFYIPAMTIITFFLLYALSTWIGSRSEQRRP